MSQICPRSKSRSFVGIAVEFGLFQSDMSRPLAIKEVRARVFFEVVVATLFVLGLRNGVLFKLATREVILS